MTPQQTQTSQTTQAPAKTTATDWLVVGAPFLMQVLTLGSILLIVLVRDGTSTNDVITALLTFLVGNTLAGGAIGVAHTITNAQLRKTAVQETGKVLAGPAGPANEQS